MAAKVELGKKVPKFKLPASDGSIFTLEQWKGKKVVLFFYPKDLTPACTQEACDFRDIFQEFAAYNTEVAGISNDPIKQHDKFITKQNLPYLLLSDEDHKVSEIFDIWQMKKLYGREYMGLVRSTFLIDEKGKLIREWRNIRVKNHAAEVLEAVKELTKPAKTKKA